MRPNGSGAVVLVCDHASNYVPPELHGLGLTAADLTRHIAWDIGAAGVTAALSSLLDAPAVFAGASRLVVDCNRQLTEASLIPEISDGTPIPGNLRLTRSARAARVDAWFRPYHDAVESVLDERQSRGVESVLISIHSMTPSLGGTPRSWTIALSSHRDRRLADPVLALLRQQEGLDPEGRTVVGDNEPYDLDPNVDYTTPFHAIRRGWLHLQVEFRQDQVATAAAQREWAVRFGRALTPALRQVRIPPGAPFRNT
jgi:predicted N-formylglutamate amidohydrolase